MKGQYLTVEYVIFFAIGVALVIAMYMTFSGINHTLSRDSVDLQLEKTGEMIRDSTLIIYEYGKRTNSNITYSLPIPSKLSGHIYSIIYSNGLNLNSTLDASIGSVLGLYNINIKQKSILYSTKGTLTIRYSENQVELL